jgi:hypothetical protein
MTEKNNLKKAMPWIKVKDKGSADLFFEYLDYENRKEFFNDLTSKEQPTIELPDFGEVEIGEKKVDINNDVKQINESEITQLDEEFIKRFLNEHQHPVTPFLDYNDKKHKYQLKPKYDIEKIIRETIKNHKTSV